jgi:PilZ domain-containing protein
MVSDDLEDRGAPTEHVPFTPERRRVPRVDVHGIHAVLPTTVEAEILDVSLTGALVRCRCPLHVGDRARLRAVLDGEPFAVSVSVVRVLNPVSADATTTSAGVAFIDHDERAVGLLRQFLASHT